MSGTYNFDDLKKRDGETEEDYQKRIEALSNVAGADNDLATVINNENIAVDQLDILREEITDSVLNEETRDPEDD